MRQTYEMYMRRCLQLARLGAGFVAPNPMVGAVLVYGDRILGEGYHMQYGQAHAEVNCLTNVASGDQPLIQESTLFVSLEPCAHFGKTPPCADLVIMQNIKKVIIGCRDPFTLVAGRGIEKLRQAGIAITEGVLETECMRLNKRFFVFHQQQRPYIILKWAQSSNACIARRTGEPVAISNGLTNRLVHRWRSEEAGILVGTNTALNDNPQLNTRLWTGNNPVRLVLDLNLRIPNHLQVFDQQQPTVVFNTIKNVELRNLTFYKINNELPLIPQILQASFALGLQSILVEGGTMLLQSFIDAGVWDEARIIENTALLIEDGLPAPVLKYCTLVDTTNCLNDRIQYLVNNRAAV